MSYMFTYQITSSEGFRGGMRDVHLKGNNNADWGFFIDTWHHGLWENLEGNDFKVGMFEHTSNQAGTAEVNGFISCELRKGNASINTPRFAHVYAGSQGQLTEIAFRDCVHVNITNGGVSGFDGNGETSDTSGIGIEFEDCERCIVDNFLAVNNDGGTTGSFDCAVYISNRSGSAGAPTNTGNHAIKNVYVEQGNTPAVDIKAKGVIIDANSATSGRPNRYNIVENVDHSQSGAGWTWVHLKNTSATASLCQSNTIIQPKRDSVHVDAVIIDANCDLNRIMVAGGGTLGFLFTDNGTNTSRVRSYHNVGALADDATPSVASKDVWRTGGTTTITDFDDGFTGQILHVLAEHAISITHGTDIVLDGRTTFVMAANDTLTLVQKANGNWYEIARSLNTVLNRTYTVSGVSFDSNYNAASTDTSELADVLGTLISDLQARKLIN